MEGSGAGVGLPFVSYLLQHTLRALCRDSEWVYAVFWRIVPRNYPPPKWETENSILDRTKGNKRNWILVWEDGFCDFSACARAAHETSPPAHTTTSSSPDHLGSDRELYGSEMPLLQPEIFFKMSHEVYNFGEGVMGKVAADSSHKWVYREPLETDLQYPPSWQSTLDPHPRTWEAQFKCGIETIAIVAVKEGLLQLGSFKKIAEDLSFVLFLQRKFNYLQSMPGVLASNSLQQQLQLARKKKIIAMNASDAQPFLTDAHRQQHTIGIKRLAEQDPAMAPSRSSKDPPPPLFSHPSPPSPPSDACFFPSPRSKSLKTSFLSLPLLRSPPILPPSLSSFQTFLSKLPPVTTAAASPAPHHLHHHHPHHHAGCASAPVAAADHHGQPPCCPCFHRGSCCAQTTAPVLISSSRPLDHPSSSLPPAAAAATTPTPASPPHPPRLKNQSELLHLPISASTPPPPTGPAAAPPAARFKTPSETPSNTGLPCARDPSTENRTGMQGMISVSEALRGSNNRRRASPICAGEEGSMMGSWYGQSTTSCWSSTSSSSSSSREGSFFHESNKLAASFMDGGSEYKAYDDFHTSNETFNALLRQINS